MDRALKASRRRAAALQALLRHARTEPAHPVDPPLVTVILSTYNWSSVLRHAVRSVLWQTYPQFELLVIGDGCTDDSEEVVAAFDDPRVHWTNLPENVGSQGGPNNAGLALARGKYVAYQGHDDVWHPKHLATLVEALEHSDADLAYTTAEVIGRPGSRVRRLAGLSATGDRELGRWIPPCSIMHRRELGAAIGGWADWRQISDGVDIEFLDRAQRSGARFQLVPALTAFKFPATARPNSYREKPSHEQEEHLRRILHERGFLYRELLALTARRLSPLPERHTFVLPESLPEQPGLRTKLSRQVRGLE